MSGRGAVRLVTALVLAGGPVLLGVPGVPGAAATAGVSARDDRVAFTINDPRITESSGLAASTRHPGVVYTHNDSGGVPKIYALDSGGRVQAVLTVGGAGARDWEGIALGKDGRGRPAIFVADIGDNLGGAWPYVTLYRIPEPDRLRSQTLRATAFKIKYADGPRNAETFMINPRTNRVYIASKVFGGKLYEGPAQLRTGGYNVMRKIGDAPAMSTDGAFSPDGRTCVIRTYFGARLYSVGPDGRPGKSLKSIDLPFQPQGESVTYTADGTALLAGSEGTNTPVYRVPLPNEARPSPSGRSGPKNSGTSADIERSDRDNGSTRTGLFLAVAIAAAVGYALLRRRGGSSRGR
ncbi:hypothetical protein BZB76_5118 [Actinomadura pelletieri DSM 43383]|uniref:WD40 repeat protein n=1 Tax=Actinomadura pelletieri DSM 43383 TaxID=1120940 RepID=A0A495QJH4_9ACTN|nr:hypothetical protein [Actinomadura pelletieri]RKS72297.1 hypothetical protein BZB76_5118 [Actinomadura pelletieri DSM 43383]